MKLEQELDGISIDINLIPDKPILVFIHGAHEHKDVGHIRDTANKLYEEEIVSVVRYSSSRNWDAWIAAATSPMVQISRIQSFDGKTYEQCLDDLRKVLGFIQERFKPNELWVSGYSHGGGLATLISKEVEIQRLLVSFPQIEPFTRDIGCYHGFPEKQDFLYAISKYNGRLEVLKLENDEMVPSSQSQELYNAAKSINKSLKVIEGTDHTLKDKRLRERYVELHKEFF